MTQTYKIYTKKYPRGVIRKGKSLKKLIYIINKIQNDTVTHIETEVEGKFINKELPREIEEFIQ